MSSISVTVRDLGVLRGTAARYGTQSSLAEAVRVSPTRIMTLLNGTRVRLKVDLAAKIEEVLATPRGSLFVLDQSEFEQLRDYLPEEVRCAC